MTKKEKIAYASSLLQEAGVDFKIGKVSYERMDSENPALDAAAKQFNDALLDEQAKKIEAYKKQFAHLSKVLHKKNLKIEELRADGSRHLRDKINVFNENRELEEVIDDISEELRISKEREAELVESIKEYQKEIAALKECGCLFGKKKHNKKSRPTEDNPEEIEIEDAVKRIRKALKDGHTVVVDYDDAADFIHTYK